MATLNVSVSSSLLNNANRFVLALYDDSAPTVLLESQAPAKAGSIPYYANPFQITFVYNCILGHTYLVKLWESVDTTPSGTTRNSTTVTPTTQLTTSRFNDELIVNSTPGLTPGSAYVNSSYIGWDIWVERLGSGTMYQLTTPVDYTYDKTTGTITPTVDWADSERVVVHFYPQITAAIPPSSSGLTAAQIITASVNLDNTYKNQALIIQGATTQMVIGLPALSSVSDFDWIEIKSFGGSHINCVVNTNGTDKINYASLVTQLIIGQTESIKLFKFSGAWYIDDISAPSINMRGELVYHSISNAINTIFSNGGLLNRVDYPGLWAFVSSLPGALMVSDSAWTGSAANRGKYSSGDGSTTFRIPQIYSFGFVRAVDGATRVPLSSQLESIGTHDHATHGKGEITGSGDFLSHTGSARFSAGGGSDQFGGQTTVDTGMRTSDNTVGSGPFENRPANIGMYALIRI